MTVNSIHFQKLNSSDIEDLKAISISTYNHAFAHLNTPENLNSYLEKAFNTTKLNEELSNPNSTFLFAKHNDTILGYIKINIGQAQTDLKENNGIELERIYVLKAFQGKKIGQQLLEYVINYAKKLNKDYLWLGVWEKNDNAIRFYKKFGFTITGTHPFVMGTETQTDYIMKLNIK